PVRIEPGHAERRALPQPTHRLPALRPRMEQQVPRLLAGTPLRVALALPDLVLTLFQTTSQRERLRARRLGLRERRREPPLLLLQLEQELADLAFALRKVRLRGGEDR